MMGKTYNNSGTKLSCGLRVLSETIRTLPHTPGVYRMINVQGEVLYVGKAKNLSRRVTSYTQAGKLPLRLQRMVSETSHMEIVTTHTEVEALLLEANLIQKLKPKYNIIFKDNKSMAYILLTDEKWPALRKHRGPQKAVGRYFGPFPSTNDILSTLSSLYRAFLLRSCSDHFFKTRKRPCLQYYIKRCSAPCVGKITPEAYRNLVKEAMQFLSGKSAQVQKQLAQEMMDLSQQQAYEQAAVLRDRIRALTQLQSRQTIFVSTLKDADVIAVAQQAGVTALQMFFLRGGGTYGTKTFFPAMGASKDASPETILQTFLSQFYQDIPPPPLLLVSHPIPEQALLEKALSSLAGHPVLLEQPKHGPKAELLGNAFKNATETLSRHLAQLESQTQILQRLTEFLGLPKLPERIEIYDNSHMQGKNAYGVMVVADNEGFLKKAYRKFIISKSIAPGDDYGMMRDVFTRRFPHEKDKMLLLPDLIIIDGGQGQLNAVSRVLDSCGLSHLPVIAISKGPDRNAGREILHRLDHSPVQLKHNDPLLYYFQRLRDEAHRFAITTHRKKGIKSLRNSRLEDIPGIGKTRKTALLRHFGSLNAIKQAAVADLCVVPSINQKIAETIYEHFQKHD